MGISWNVATAMIFRSVQKWRIPQQLPMNGKYNDDEEVVDSGRLKACLWCPIISNKLWILRIISSTWEWVTIQVMMAYPVVISNIPRKSGSFPINLSTSQYIHMNPIISRRL